MQSVMLSTIIEWTMLLYNAPSIYVTAVRLEQVGTVMIVTIAYIFVFAVSVVTALSRKMAKWLVTGLRSRFSTAN